MQWSRLKQLVVARMAPAVAERVDLHTARYRHASDGDGRCWITIDGREVADFCRFRAAAAQGRLAADLRAVAGTTDFRNPDQLAGYREADQQATTIAHRQGLYTQFEFYTALEEYLSLPLEAALNSETMPIRALAVLDRRLGKRRLRTLLLRDDEHPLVRELFALRCAAERVEILAPESQCFVAAVGRSNDGSLRSHCFERAQLNLGVLDEPKSIWCRASGWMLFSGATRNGDAEAGYRCRSRLILPALYWNASARSHPRASSANALRGQQ